MEILLTLFKFIKLLQGLANIKNHLYFGQTK